MFYSEMKMPNLAKFIFHFLCSQDLVGMNAGSAVPSMTTAILNAIEIRVPSEEALEEFEGIVSPMYIEVQANNSESEKLRALRDALLPKLMSGELDVSDLDS